MFVAESTTLLNQEKVRLNLNKSIVQKPTNNIKTQINKINLISAKLSTRSPAKKTPSKKPLAHTRNNQNIISPENLTGSSSNSKTKNVFFATEIDDINGNNSNNSNSSCNANENISEVETGYESSYSELCERRRCNKPSDEYILAVVDTTDHCSDESRGIKTNNTVLNGSEAIISEQFEEENSSNEESNPNDRVDMTTRNDVVCEAKCINQDSLENFMNFYDQMQCDETINIPEGTEGNMEIENPSSNITEQEIKAFEESNDHQGIDIDTLLDMIQNEFKYIADPYYFQKYQPKLQVSMRPTLIDWMMRFCSDFCFARETFHRAINFVDRYLTKIPNVDVSELQLIGLTAIMISAKIEQIDSYGASTFCKAAGDICTVDEILNMELKMMKALNFNMIPITIFTWANRYLAIWDTFIELSPVVYKSQLINNQKDCELIQFKVAVMESYHKYREFMQMIDCAMLDTETLKYDTRALVASFLYLTVGKYYRQFSLKEIVGKIPNSSYFLYNDSKGLNQIFSEFLRLYFGYQLEELLPTIQYASRFFNIPISSFEYPVIVKIKPNILEDHYEDFLSYQTY